MGNAKDVQLLILKVRQLPAHTEATARKIMRFQALLPFFGSVLADCRGDSDYRMVHNWWTDAGDGKNQMFESFLTLHLPDHDIDSWDVTVHFKVRLSVFLVINN